MTHTTPSLSPPSTAEDVTESEFPKGIEEVAIVKGVDEGVDDRVDVAEPREHGDHDVGDVAATKRADDVHEEERQPTHGEAAYDDGQRFGRLPFLLHRRSFPALIPCPIALHPTRPVRERNVRRTARAHRGHLHQAEPVDVLRQVTRLAAAVCPRRRVSLVSVLCRLAVLPPTIVVAPAQVLVSGPDDELDPQVRVALSLSSPDARHVVLTSHPAAAP